MQHEPLSVIEGGPDVPVLPSDQVAIHLQWYHNHLTHILSLFRHLTPFSHMSLERLTISTAEGHNSTPAFDIIHRSSSL